MPPVFGPCVAVADALEVLRRRRARARSPVAEREERDSSPSSSSSITSEPPSAAAAGRAASSSSCVRQTNTPLPAASPSALTTHGGGRPTASARSARRRRPSPPSRRSSSPRSRRPGARPEHGDAGVAQLVGDTGDERRLRPDHDEVDLERAREPEQPLQVDRPYRMARADLRDSGVSGRGVKLLELRALGELPRERVLPAARSDEQGFHPLQCFKGVGEARMRMLRIVARRSTQQR